MHDTAFDLITKHLARLASRRGALRTALGASLVGTLPLSKLAEARSRKRKKPGKKKKRPTTGPPGPGGGGATCPATQTIDGVCCPPAQIFVKCPDVCLCEANQNFCCATSSQVPVNCPADPNIAPALCCPAADVCGDVCCDPWQEHCDAGECRCQPANQCGPHCCDPRFFSCNVAEQRCECILPDPLDCPSGTGGFVRVRRF